MAVNLRRPILVGGLGLSFALWILDSWKDSFFQFGELAVLALALIGGGLWLLKPNAANAIAGLNELPSDRSTAEKAIASAETVVNQLAQEVETHPALEELRQKLAQLPSELDRKDFHLAVTGGKSVGKTSIIEQLKAHAGRLPAPAIAVYETQPLFCEANPVVNREAKPVVNREANPQTDAEILASTAAWDYVLFVINGDLTETEFRTIQQINLGDRRSSLVFNKQDLYLSDERVHIVNALKRRVSNVVAVSAVPQPIKVRKHSEDGVTQEWMEQPAPDLSQLTAGLNEVITQYGQNLIWATTTRKAYNLKTTAKNHLNQHRRDRAVPIIEQYQWVAAAAAFANPVPALDILATAAVNAQMIVDLGKIYNQQFSLDQAKAIAGEMGGMMLKLGLVELSTKAVSTILKTNAVTFAIGGVVQGVSAAYLTRVAGLALVEYFQAQEIALTTGNGLNLDTLRQTLQLVFQQNQQVANLQAFVSQGVKRLLPDNTAAQIAS